MALRTTDIVQTTNGPVYGFIDQDTSIQVFKNIPYGGDTSKTRFKAPVEPSNWTELRNCTAFGPVAPQPWGREIPGAIESEDCLNLNVWSPALDKKKRPVLVWFHGGGYESMTSNSDSYDGTKLASKRDAVVVTVNHRIGGFGYMYLGELNNEYKQGNAGQLDLILALRWVRDNISSFGGDKDSITIFGQSGGGAKCATLMAMVEAQGLFHRVWTMSGQQITGRTVQHANETALQVLSKMEGGSSLKEKLSRLQNMPLIEVRKLMAGAGNQWTPVVDGITLPRDPFFPTANEQSKDIPMVIGNTYDETRSLIGGSNQKYFKLKWEEVPEALEKSVRQFLGNMSTAEIVAAYKQQYPSYSPTDVFFSATTAARSWKSMLVETEIRAKQPNSPLWVYYYRWKSPLDNRRMGAAHSMPKHGKIAVLANERQHTIFRSSLQTPMQRSIPKAILLRRNWPS
jgi:para-nitrobenzyl esterase